MSYPVSYRRAATARQGGNASTARIASLARSFADGNALRRYPLGSENIGNKSADVIKLGAKFAAQRQLRLLTRLLLTRFGPFGVISLTWELYTLLRAFQALQPAYWNAEGGWETIVNCGANGVGPFPQNQSGCTGNKFISASTSGQIQDVPNFYYCCFLRLPVTLIGGTYVGPLGQTWRKVKADGNPNPPPVPVLVPAVPARNPVYLPRVHEEIVIGRLPDAIKDQLAEWPEAYQGEEPVAPPAVPQAPPLGGVSAGARRYSVPSERWEVKWSRPLPYVTASPRAFPRARPRPRWEPRPRVDLRPDVYSPRKPPPHTAEVKVRTSAAFRLINQVIGTVTEGLDVVTALYKALPKKYGRKHNVRFNTKMERILRAIRNGDLEVGKAMEELFWNQVEDMLYGRLGKAQAKAVRRLAEKGLWHSPTGTTVGGSTRQDLQAATGIKSEDPVSLLRNFIEGYTG